jgi:hypothetical protein
MTARLDRFLAIATRLPAFALVAAVATASHAQLHSPTAGPAATVSSARVVQVDPASGTVMAQRSEGPAFQALAGKEAAMIGPIRPGDTLAVAGSPAVILKLEPLATRGVALAESQEQAAHPLGGSQRGIVREVTTTATAEVAQVDPAARTLLLRGPRGATRQVHASDPSLDLSRVRNGQMVRIVSVETTTVTVDAPATAPQ